MHRAKLQLAAHSRSLSLRNPEWLAHPWILPQGACRTYSSMVCSPPPPSTCPPSSPVTGAFSRFTGAPEYASVGNKTGPRTNQHHHPLQPQTAPKPQGRRNTGTDCRSQKQAEGGGRGELGSAVAVANGTRR